MDEGLDRRVDIGVALLLIVFCGVILFESRTLPPGSFEPLGSAPVPQATALLIILFALIVIVRALLRSPVGEESSEVPPAYFDASIIVVLTIAYVIVLQARILEFSWLTLIFLFLTIGFLTRFHKKTLPIVVVVALIVGFGAQYIFTRVFVVDLPGL